MEPTAHPLSRHRIGTPCETTSNEDVLIVQSPLSVGQFAGRWASYNAPPDRPYDQREEDGRSLVFDPDELTERVEILGSPSVELELSVSEPVAMVAARLSDVAPDGSATRVTYGLLNLTHPNGTGPPPPGTRRAVPGHGPPQRRDPGIPPDTASGCRCPPPTGRSPGHRRGRCC